VSAAPGQNQVATATIDVTNTGRSAGIAVPELYIGKPAINALAQPPRQLVGYDSVEVPAGRTVRVSFPLNDRSFATWDSTGWRLLPGCYRLAAGSSSRALPSQAVISRGVYCSRAAAQLGTSGDFSLPVPATASATLLPRPRRRCARCTRRRAGVHRHRHHRH
jgi:beta-glucosidase